MSDFHRRLADAWLDVLNRGVEAGHSEPFPAREFVVVCTQLAARTDLAAVEWRLPRTELDNLLAEGLGREKIKKAVQWVSELYDRLPLLIAEGADSRPTRRDELPNPAMVSGSELLGNADPERIRRRIAHDYLLRYPEALPLLAVFRPPGAARASLDRYVDAFVGVRRLNPTNTNYVFQELRELRLTEEDAAGGRWRLTTGLPAPAVAYYTLKSYLEFGGFQLPLPQLGWDTVETHLRGVCPGARIDGPWNHELRPSGLPLFRPENHRADLRLDPDDLLWLIRGGLADGTWVGRLLRQADAREELSRIHERTRQVLDRFDNPPDNIDQYLACFDPDAR